MMDTCMYLGCERPPRFTMRDAFREAGLPDDLSAKNEALCAECFDFVVEHLRRKTEENP